MAIAEGKKQCQIWTRPAIKLLPKAIDIARRQILADGKTLKGNARLVYVLATDWYTKHYRRLRGRLTPISVELQVRTLNETADKKIWIEDPTDIPTLATFKAQAPAAPPKPPETPKPAPMPVVPPPKPAPMPTCVGAPTYSEVIRSVDQLRAEYSTLTRAFDQVQQSVRHLYELQVNSTRRSDKIVDDVETMLKLCFESLASTRSSPKLIEETETPVVIQARVPVPVAEVRDTKKALKALNNPPIPPKDGSAHDVLASEYCYGPEWERVCSFPLKPAEAMWLRFYSFLETCWRNRNKGKLDSNVTSIIFFGQRFDARVAKEYFYRLGCQRLVWVDVHDQSNRMKFRGVPGTYIKPSNGQIVLVGPSHDDSLALLIPVIKEVAGGYGMKAFIGRTKHLDTAEVATRLMQQAFCHEFEEWQNQGGVHTCVEYDQSSMNGYHAQPH